MKLFFAGQPGRAVCDTCGVVETTFAYRDVPFADGSGVVKDILAGVCTQCGQVATIPAQSVPAIKRAKERATESIEAVLPSPYLEALDLACHKIDANASLDLRKRLLLFYVHRFSCGLLDVARLAPAHQTMRAQFPVGSAGPRRRLSLKVSKGMADEFHNMAKAAAMGTTDLLKSLVAEIKAEILDRDTPGRMAELKSLAAVTAC